MSNDAAPTTAQSAVPTTAQSAVAWRPDAATLEHANLARFMRAAGVASYEELLARADAEPAWFYDALLKHLDYRFYRPYTQVLDESRGAPWTRWCVGGTTNVVLNAIDRWRGTPTWDKPALEWKARTAAARPTRTARWIAKSAASRAGCARSGSAAAT